MPELISSTPKDPGQKLADWRQKAGLTQAALARQIGASRQFLNQLEAGRVLPNVVIALRLGKALGRTVEELFGEAAAAADGLLTVLPVPPDIPVSARLRLGRVGKTWIAHPADTAGSLAAGFGSADAILESNHSARLLVPPAGVASNVLVAGCDPALALLQPGAGQPGDGRCHWIDCSSGHSLDLLAAGHIHVAGIHYAGKDGTGNVQELKKRDPLKLWSLVRFTRWEQGWIFRRRNGESFSGLESLAEKKWMLINRDASAAARRWLDHELTKAGIAAKKIPGYGTCAPSSVDCARAVANGQADVTIGPRAVARAHGLEFLPAEAVDFDLVAPSVWWRSPSGRELLKCINALASTGTLGSLPGYASTASGESRPRPKQRSAA